MTKSLEQMLAERPVDRAAVEAHKARMIDEVRAYRLQELRKSVAMTQEQLAERLGVGQNRVSNIEHGDLERVRNDSLVGTVEAVGGSLRVEVELGDERFRSPDPQAPTPRLDFPLSHAGSREGREGCRT